jgi:hypothetical protein
VQLGGRDQRALVRQLQAPVAAFLYVRRLHDIDVTATIAPRLRVRVELCNGLRGSLSGSLSGILVGNLVGSRVAARPCQITLLQKARQLVDLVHRESGCPHPSSAAPTGNLGGVPVLRHAGGGQRLGRGVVAVWLGGGRRAMVTVTDSCRRGQGEEPVDGAVRRHGPPGAPAGW